MFKTILRKKEGDTITRDKIVNEYRTSTFLNIHFIVDLPANTFSIIPKKVNFQYPCFILKDDYMFGFNNVEITSNKIPIFNNQMDLKLVVLKGNYETNWINSDSELSIEYEITTYENKYSFDIINREVRKVNPILYQPKSSIFAIHSANIIPQRRFKFDSPINLRILTGLDPSDEEDELIDTVNDLEAAFIDNHKLKGEIVIFKNIYNTTSFLKILISNSRLNPYIEPSFTNSFFSTRLYYKLEPNYNLMIDDVGLYNHIISQSDLYQSLFLLIVMDNPLIKEVEKTTIKEFIINPRFLHYQIIQKIT